MYMYIHYIYTYNKCWHKWFQLELAFSWTMFWWTRTMEDVGASPATCWWLVFHPAGRLMFSHFIHGQWIQIDPNSVRGFEVRRRCDFASNSIFAVVIPIFDSFGRQIDMFEKHQIPVAFCQEKPWSQNERFLARPVENGMFQQGTDCGSQWTSMML